MYKAKRKTEYEPNRDGVPTFWSTNDGRLVLNKRAMSVKIKRSGRKKKGKVIDLKYNVAGEELFEHY